uniref:RxLR effector protein n=1 Tax=Chromera velia CCMP2878 TaxID=1169474 RepID=A0A0G4I4X8_9ALVE|eukprot:Cvel_11005.t1-p1 / transcript=Cvel_11005.t1 / gene=Cvel_11005 / organism=Chromera_velia_CCMP2878 / gene_product=hypothetical protein / transcript_product=hypothetical protein / location=Cvel_scaffold678:27547-28942(+) / protein_length=122 / sequence_SO=supercontig / SO=protein_coding / is_pseudo=false
MRFFATLLVLFVSAVSAITEMELLEAALGFLAAPQRAGRFMRKSARTPEAETELSAMSREEYVENLEKSNWEAVNTQGDGKKDKTYLLKSLRRKHNVMYSIDGLAHKKAVSDWAPSPNPYGK